ncbi:MAG: isoprenylcysteine carboxylmethyltransferase family protein [Rhizobiaceae bacterium]
MSSLKESPNKYPLPPILTFGMLVLCLLLDTYMPLGWEPEQVTNLMRGAGILLIVVSLGLMFWTFRTFRKFSANMMPNRPASQLLTTGPFAHSRNPIYLGDVLLVAGFGFLLGSRWFLFGAVVLFFLLGEMVIKREEKHLEANFPEAWADYSKLVRRWI